MSSPRAIPSSAEPGRRGDQTAADRRRFDRARRERERRIVERGVRILAALRQRASGTDGVGV